MSRVSKAAVAAVFVAATMSFAGWAFDLPWLADWANAGTAIQPNTAVAIAAFAMALLVLDRRPRIAFVSGVAIVLLGVVTLAQTILNVDAGIDELLLFGRPWGRYGTTARGRFGPPAAVGLTLLGAGLVVLAAAPPGSRRAGLRKAVPWLGLVVIAIAMFSLAGYAFEAEIFQTAPWLTTHAWQTAVMLFLAAIGLITAVPDHAPMSTLLESSGAATLARVVLPTLVFLPLLLGALRAFAEQRGLVDRGTGRATVATVSIFVTVGLMWWALEAVRRRERREAESAQTVIETLESISDGFFRLDADSRLVYVNAAAERLCAMRRAQMLGHTLRELFPGFAGSELERGYDEARRGPVVERESYYEPWARWFAVRASPTRDGGLAVYFQDISDRKRAEQALRASEERLQLAMNVAATGTWDYDLLTDTLHWSESHFRLLGLPPSPTGRADPQMLRDAMPSEDYERMMEEWRRAEREHDLFRMEHRICRADNTMLWARAAGRFFYDDSGRAIRFVGAFFDMSEHARSEQLEREHNRALELVASGLPLPECLTALTETAASLQPGLRAGVVVSDSARAVVTDVISAQLPESFAAGIRGTRTDEMPMGTWAGAIQRGELVVCTDVATTGSWTEAWRELCLRHGILACAAIPIVGEGGRPVAAFMLCLDEPREITDWERRIGELGAHVAGVAIERDRVAVARRASEEQLRVIFESAPDLVVITMDLDGVITGWNPGAEHLLGWSADEVIGRPAEVIFTAGDIEAGVVDWEVDTVLREGKAENERWHVRKDGSRFWGSGLVMRVTDEVGQPRALVKIMRDRTEAKLAELAIREREQRFRLLVDVTTDVTWTADAEGRFVTAQPAWSAYTGQDLEAYRGFGWTEAVHPDDRESVIASWRAACEAKTLYRGSGRVWHAATRSYRYYEARALPLLEEDGSVREWVGACTDVHERRLAEQEAREESRRKDEFLATLAHELRNPLAPVRHGLDLLRTPTADDGLRERVVDMMERQLRHMVRLVDDLLEVSRITRGKIELRKEIVDLASVVRSALEAAAPAIEAGHHRLSVGLLSEPILVEGDPVRLAQVVGNLLNNAAKYTEDGGQIRVTISRRDDRASISVRDTGIGIAPDMLPHVFDLFTQIRTSGRAQGGLGIGLALVANLVRMHGGTVEARSDGPGRGAEFVVTLPVVAARTSTEDAPADGKPHALVLSPTRPLLVVDDNRDAADTLSMLLELQGREVRTAYDGTSGLAAIRAEHPAVVFLDIGMPDIDGYAVAAEVRGDPELSDVRLVALTGWGSEEDRRRSRAAGFDHHLVKPVDASTVRTLLATLEREVLHRAS